MSDRFSAVMDRSFARYAMAAVVVAISLLLHLLLAHGLSLQLPPFILLYPAVMLVAILAGLWPGILATALAALGTDYLFLPPFGRFTLATSSDFFALALFALMGILISLFAEHHRSSLRSIATYKAELARRQVEEQLRQASEYRRLALEAAGLGAWELRIDSREFSGDALWHKFLGFLPDEPITLDAVIRRVHPDDLARMRDSFNQAMTTRSAGIWHELYRVVWPDGSQRWLSSHGQLDCNSDSGARRPTRFIGVTMDITENKLAEEAREADRAKLDAALASMADAVFISDTNGNFIEFNDAFATFHKFRDKAECLSTFAGFQNLIELSTPDGESIPFKMWSSQRALRGETASNVEYHVRRKDTGESWFGSFSFSPIRDRQGTIIGAVIVARDITGKKLAERTLAEYRAKLDVALASMADAVFISDASGNFIEFNDAFATFHRFPGKADCPTTFSAFTDLLEVSTLDGKPVPPEMRTSRRALNGEIASSVEFRLRRKDTGESWIGSYSFSPIRDNQGVIIGAVVVARDVTEIKAAEQKLRESEEHYRNLFNSMVEGFCILEVLFDDTGKPSDLRFLSINAAFETQTGLRNAVGRRVREMAPSLEEFWFDTYGRVALSGEPAHFINEAAPLGRIYEVHAYRVGDPGQHRVAAVFNDISDRVRAELHIRHLNRVYSVLSDINQTIVRERDSKALLEASCRIAVEKGLFRMAWIGMVNPDTLLLEPVASSGAVEGYLDKVRIDFHESTPEDGPAARCFFTGGHAVCNDIEHELRRPWKNDALALGYRSAASFPLRRKDKVVGIFTLYAAELAFFDQDELKLLDEMAMDISFALEVNRHEEQRREAEQHVRQLNRVYAVLSGINETIVREKDSQALLEAACRIAVEKGQFRMAWIGMINPETQLLEPLASSGEVGEYLHRLSIDPNDQKHYDGPALHSVQSKSHSICNDIEHDPIYAVWRDDAMKLGFRSSAALPLLVEGQVAGVFNLYAAEPGFFSGDELALLDEMAKDISFALEVIRHETDRRKKEEELRWRTAFFEAQIDSSLDGVLVVDNQGKVILQNERMRDLFHIPPEIASDLDDARQLRSVLDRIKNPELFLEKIQHLYAQPDQIGRDEIELIDGTIIDRYSAPVRDKTGNYFGRIWTFRDITQARQLEEQFRQSQKMESIGQLTGGIAHDFNNLLTVIQGCSEFIAEEAKDNPRLAKMAAMILDSSKRGSDLTHRMLAFARRQALQPRPVDINLLIANLESFLRRTLSADINLQIVPSREACTALIDPTQLENALLNLCVNARDAMPGGGRLVVETGVVDLDATYADQFAEVVPGPYILIAVSDSGAGINPENLARVFDPFFTTKEAGKGTGLGLSMVYGFIKQSRGHIRIYSELGKGTSVKLYLPVADTPGMPARPKPTLLADLKGSETILLAEDNDSVREFAAIVLADLGYRVLEAANGNEALELLRRHPKTALLFTDVVMPGMNGHELAIEASRLNPKLKVLYCSGYAEQAILGQWLKDSNVQLLNKPYSRLELARRVRSVLVEDLPPGGGI